MSIEDLKDKRYGKVGTKSRSDAEERLQLEKIGILLKEKIGQLERENQQLKESEEREKKIAYSWWFNSPERLVKDFDEFYNQIKDELTNKTK